VKTGLEVLLEDYIDKIYDKNIALVTNHSGIDKSGDSNVSRLLNFDSIQLVKIFTSEHGFTGMVPDGEHIKNDLTSLNSPPIISLYGKTKKPTQEMLSNIDIIIYDIQDLGARFYTYISTLGLVMEAAGEANIPVMVLDRPNPIGGKIDGPILYDKFKSFIGMYPIPIQYSMTVGELAKMVVGEKMIEHLPELTVIPMENYNRNLFFDQTYLPWKNPSPNIPDLETAIIYPGLCIFEATNVSEGRGTYSPFKQIGAPWIDAKSLINLLSELRLSGVIIKPTQFTPVSIATMSKYPKFENQNCNGVNISITNRDVFNSILTGVSVLWSINKLYPDNLLINKDSMGRLWGSDNLYKQLQEGKTPSEIVNLYQNELNNFKQIRNKYLIYD
ncbi:exo-beta-N-acetylmuramidase NamZ domain-containing protein, partial [Candidatus Neomarinimicrobiota bacterium]